MPSAVNPDAVPVCIISDNRPAVNSWKAKTDEFLIKVMAFFLLSESDEDGRSFD